MEEEDGLLQLQLLNRAEAAVPDMKKTMPPTAELASEPSPPRMGIDRSAPIVQRRVRMSVRMEVRVRSGLAAESGPADRGSLLRCITCPNRPV